MRSKISNFAEITLGYAFRGAVESDNKGKTFLIQAKNIVQGENVSGIQGLTTISFDGTRTASFVQKNDILLVSRWTGSGSFRASVCELDRSDVLVSSSLIIIRVKDNNIIPEYIAIYLNSSEWQNEILNAVIGSYVKAISRKKFEEIKIPIPPLIKQKNMVWLYQNIVQQGKIYHKKIELKQKLLTATLKNLIHP